MFNLIGFCIKFTRNWLNQNQIEREGNCRLNPNFLIKDKVLNCFGVKAYA
jgi:hypothetical protein